MWAFQSTSPTGEDTSVRFRSLRSMSFQSTSPTGEDTAPLRPFPYRGGHFNPLPPQGKTLLCSGIEIPHILYFNPLPPQGKTPDRAASHSGHPTISIHFPHRGRHEKRWEQLDLDYYFNPLPPQGKTHDYCIIDCPPDIFQSTSPTGEDTCFLFRFCFPERYFNPLPPQGKTRLPMYIENVKNLLKTNAPEG